MSSDRDRATDRRKASVVSIDSKPPQSLEALLVEDAPNLQDDPLESLPRYSKLTRLAIVAGGAGGLWALIWWLARGTA